MTRVLPGTKGGNPADGWARRGQPSRSLSAGINAAFRARETARQDGARILNDPLAGLFVENDWRVKLLRAAEFCWPPLRRMAEELQTVHCVRHRTIDLLVLEAVANGYSQIVIAGSGYDTRPWRLRPPSGGLQWFEADHPATQRRKQQILARTEEIPRGAAACPADFAESSIAESLAESDFDPSRPVCVVMEGLVHYLKRSRFEAILSELGRLARCRLIFSFIDTEVYLRAPGLLIEVVKLLREVPHLHFTRLELADLCAQAGFGGLQSWNLEEQIRLFAPEAKGRPAGVHQSVVQVETGRKMP